MTFRKYNRYQSALLVFLSIVGVALSISSAGDLNSDGQVNLSDVTIGLNILTGTPQPPENTSGSDVNGDGRLGAQEIVNALHKNAGLRGKAVILPPGPFISAVSDNSAIISWITNGPSTVNSVQFGTSTAYGLTAHAFQTDTATEDAGAYHVHAAKLTGLNAATRYYYRVRSDNAINDNAGVGWYFDTFPAVGTSDFSFMVYGDTRYNGEGPSVDYYHEIVLGNMVQEDANLILHVGDAVYRIDNLLEWSGSLPLLGIGDPVGEFFRLAGASQFPIIQRKWIAITKGNHEIAGVYENARIFEKTFEFPNAKNGLGTSPSESYYAFDYANARIIVLNHHSREHIDSTQLTWLENELQTAQAAGRWIFVTVHQPPIGIKLAEGWGNTKLADGSMYLLEADVVPLFQQYGVDLVFSGHSHMYAAWEKALYYKGKSATPPVIEESDTGVRYMIQGTGTTGMHAIDLTSGHAWSAVYDDEGPLSDYVGSGRIQFYPLDVTVSGAGSGANPLYSVITVSGDTCTVVTKSSAGGDAPPTIFHTYSFTRTRPG